MQEPSQLEREKVGSVQRMRLISITRVKDWLLSQLKPEREARLQQMQDRLAAESAGERKARLYTANEN